MQRKLTITVDETVYRALHAQVGSAKISIFIEELVRSRLFTEDDEDDLEAGYAAMARDEQHEREAAEWADALIADSSS